MESTGRLPADPTLPALEAIRIKGLARAIPELELDNDPVDSRPPGCGTLYDVGFGSARHGALGPGSLRHVFPRACWGRPTDASVPTPKKPPRSWLGCNPRRGPVSWSTGPSTRATSSTWATAPA